MTRLERRKSVEDCWHERLKVLELDAPVHRGQRVVLASHAPQKLAVRDARPATAGHGIDTVALERSGKV